MLVWNKRKIWITAIVAVSVVLLGIFAIYSFINKENNKSPNFVPFFERERGFNIFDSGFTDLPEDELETYATYALASELEDIIGRLDEVESARVFLTLAEKDVRDKASVSIETLEGKELEPHQVRTISKLISFITNIPEEDITICDAESGDLLVSD